MLGFPAIILLISQTGLKYIAYCSNKSLTVLESRLLVIAFLFTILMQAI